MVKNVGRHLQRQLQERSIPFLAIFWKLNRIYEAISRYITMIHVPIIRYMPLSVYHLQYGSIQNYILNHVYLILAMKWRTDEHDPDLYDARMRDWYIKVSYPKNIWISENRVIEKLTRLAFLVLTRCLCIIVCCLSQRNCDSFGHLRFNDRVEKRDC